MPLEPLFFKSGERSLFGIFEPAQRPCKCVAVICNAFEPEHVGCHRALKKLGERLTRLGIDVFRFDFAGMGDSSGDFGRMDMTQWQTDVNAAVDLARRRFRCRKVVLLGVRMGATMAALTCASRGDIHAAVLWEPVLDGATFVDDQRTVHNTPTPDGILLPPIKTDTDGITEIVGLRFTDPLLAAFAETSLADLVWPPHTKVQVVTNMADASSPRVAELLAAQDIDFEHIHVKSPLVWIDHEQVPGAVLQAISEWVQKQL
jgi:pimeloyl-ACP methyl ester carboxylesterase